MIKKIFNLFYLILVHIICWNIESKRPVYISLGKGCGPALSLRDLGIRSDAYPFDWVVSPFQSLYNCLQDDFKYFLTEITLMSQNRGIVDYYGFQFPHDLPTNNNPNIDVLNTDFVGNNYIILSKLKESLPKVKEKYLRRISRFRKVCSGHEKVIFIRWSSNKDEAILLKNYFRQRYPDLRFILVILSNDPTFKTPWNIPYVRNFYSHTWHDPRGLIKLLVQIDPQFINRMGREIDQAEFCKIHEHCEACSDEFFKS